MAIIGYNQAQEYNVRMTNSLQNCIRNQGYEIIEENSMGLTMTELMYVHPEGTRYAYIQETGGMSDAPGQKSIISDKKLSYEEADIEMHKAEREI